ncbi:unnamed protein product [Moneuplotes crassus]|uniref:CDT1 Geminin-binding domain-containing protein n=1 Tax=Euplotes crassus TaxID=5936 RepID=A0AAD1Y7L0_EUPCR|nr:unnamed protein product [Moneuplotes crassus]
MIGNNTVNRFFRNKGKSTANQPFSTNKKSMKEKDLATFSMKKTLKPLECQLDAKVVNGKADWVKESNGKKKQVTSPEDRDKAGFQNKVQGCQEEFKFQISSKPSNFLDSKIHINTDNAERTNRKRKKVNSYKKGSEEREVVIPCASQLHWSKHNNGTAIFKKKEGNNTVTKDAGKQVTFNQDVSIISNKKRELKKKSKIDAERILSLMSSTSLDVIKEVIANKEQGYESKSSKGELCKNISSGFKPDFVRCPNKQKFENLNKKNQILDKTPEPTSRSNVLARLKKETLKTIKSVIKRKNTDDQDQWLCEQGRTKPEIEAQEILKAPSISEKYQELLTDKAPEVVFPAQYKLLIRFYAALDEVILFFKKRGKVCIFEELAVSVENSTKRNFNKANFGQILTVSPDSYTYEWKDLKGKRGYSLVLDVPDRALEIPSAIQKRKDEFKNKLFEKANEHHQKFLRQVISKRPNLKDYLEDFDPIQMGGWYHEFDPHKRVPPIEPKEIMGKPKAAKRSESVSEFMKRNRSIQKKFSLANISGSRERSSDHEEDVHPNALSSIKKTKIKLESKPSATVKTIKGIPIDLLERIQLRESASSQEKQEKELEFKKNKPKMEQDILTRLIDSIKSIYSVRNLSSLPLKKVLSLLSDTTKGRFESTTNLREKLEDLCSASPDWLKIISTPKGEFLKIKTTYSKRNVKLDIERYTKQKYAVQE